MMLGSLITISSIIDARSPAVFSSLVMVERVLKELQQQIMFFLSLSPSPSQRKIHVFFSFAP